MSEKDSVMEFLITELLFYANQSAFVNKQTNDFLKGYKRSLNDLLVMFDEIQKENHDRKKRIN